MCLRRSIGFSQKASTWVYLINFFPKIQIPGIKHINGGSIFKKSFALGNELYPINHDNKMPIFFFHFKSKVFTDKTGGVCCKLQQCCWAEDRTKYCEWLHVASEFMGQKLLPYENFLSLSLQSAFLAQSWWSWKKEIVSYTPYLNPHLLILSVLHDAKPTGKDSWVWPSSEQLLWQILLLNGDWEYLSHNI